jgi:DNA-binding response OmpR family regulator
MADKKKILLIDDEEDFCFFVKNNLEQTEEFSVSYTTNPDKGIRIARKDPPDLILLDILMPTMEGSDVAGDLLADPRTRQIPVIFLTAVVTQEEIGLKMIKEIGGQSFIAKPVDTESLSSCIKIALRDYPKA